MFGVFIGGQRPGDPAADIMNIGFRALGVFFNQYFTGDFLFGKRNGFRRFGNCGQGKLL